MGPHAIQRVLRRAGWRLVEPPDLLPPLAVLSIKVAVACGLAGSWYDSVYRPLMDIVHAEEMERRLPGWTDTDVYLALTRLWLDLDEEGLPSGPDRAAMALLADPEAGA